MQDGPSGLCQGLGLNAGAVLCQVITHSLAAGLPATVFGRGLLAYKLPFGRVIRLRLRGQMVALFSLDDLAGICGLVKSAAQSKGPVPQT
jgi:hypothetical protein